MLTAQDIMNMSDEEIAEHNARMTKIIGKTIVKKMVLSVGIAVAAAFIAKKLDEKMPEDIS